MNARIEELAKMAYEAGHHPTSADFADIGPAAKENLRIIVRTLYAAIMTEAAGELERRAKIAARFVSDRAHLMHPMRCPSDELKSALEDQVAVDRKFRQAAAALHARAKESAP